jgi:hypothetical protein
MICFCVLFHTYWQNRLATKTGRGGGGKNRRKRKYSNKIERNTLVGRGRKYVGIFHYIMEEASSEKCSVKSDSKVSYSGSVARSYRPTNSKSEPSDARRDILYACL